MVAARIGQTSGIQYAGLIGERSSVASERPAIEHNPPLQGGSVGRRRSGLLSLLGLGRGGRNAAGVGAIVGSAIGFSLLGAPSPAFADYLRAHPNNTYEIVRSESTAPLIPAEVAGENRDQIRALEATGGLSERELSDFPLFRKFWTELANVGEFEIAPSHLHAIIEYASTHSLDGTRLPELSIPGPESARAVTEGNRALIRHLLQHPYYSGFFEQEARPMLEAAFGLPIERVEARGVNHPTDAGDIDLSALPPWQGTHYAGNLVANLHQDLASEFRLNRNWYEGGTKEQSSERLTAMLLHFGRAIHMHEQLDSTANAMVAVSDAFHRLPIFEGDGERATFLREFFKKDYNGLGIGLAESIIRGFAPNQVRTSFPDANNRAESTTSLSMSATGYSSALKMIDDYRAAIGLEPGAVDRFQLSVFNGVIGGRQGNNKTGLSERTPFSSLVNFGIVMEFGSNGNFARDADAARLPPKPGFEFPIDAITATGIAVSGHDATLRVYQQQADGRAGARVSAERVIHNDSNGQPEYWSAIFRDSSGAEVPPDRVIGLVERNRRPLGDGLANQTLESGYWGYCELNTAQTLQGATHRIPALDVTGNVYIAAGDRVIAVPRDVAQQIVNFGVASSISRTKFAGHRHDRDAQEVRWLRGDTLVTDWGRLEGIEMDPRQHPRAAIEWHEGDHLQLNFGEGRGRTPGSIRIETSLVLKTVRGTEEIIRADQLKSVSGETEHDIRFTYFMRFVIDSGGIYGTDASTGSSVSNGPRYVNHIDFQVERGAGRPKWARHETLSGIYGPLVRQPGDHIVFAAGTYGEQNSVAWKGWYQVNDRGQIVNEGWISGMPDMAWGGTGGLNWQSTSSFVSELPWEMRVKLFVNGRKELRDNTPQGDELARRLKLPSNWRDYITPRDRIPA